MTAASPLEVLWAVDGRPPLPSANTAGVCAATGPLGELLVTLSASGVADELDHTPATLGEPHDRSRPDER